MVTVDRYKFGDRLTGLGAISNLLLKARCCRFFDRFADR
jgi:hypothetical protein